MNTIEDLQYPIGRHNNNNNATVEEMQQAIETLAFFPIRLEHEIQNLDEYQLEIPYRQGGWNIRQVVHHCADSHLNCLIRLKLALTESNPMIKPFAEDLWANCKDYYLPINNSTTLLHAVHKKLVVIFKNLSAEEWGRTYFHPQQQQELSIAGLLLLYAWHCNHHLAHITHLKNRMRGE